ncbi:MAG: hypothetical protein SFV15_04465 [Polyangiaceae bacterium]|nr:hypothetical protein [Polyangiaceae bacterium]
MNVKLHGGGSACVRGLLKGVALLGSCGWLVACAASTSGGAKSADGVIEKRDTTIEHEACDTKGASERLDANADGTAEIVIVRSGDREICRSVDLNFDGVPDAWAFLDAQGKLRRKELDFDRDGRIDEIDLFQNGVISEKRRATSLANRLDTWDFFQGGKLARTERDSNGDAVVDQWWEYPQPGCPLIHSDSNGDGRPDPGATINYCKETGYVPPERQADSGPKTPDFQRPGDSLPTETEEKTKAPPADAEAPKSAAPEGDKK